MKLYLAAPMTQLFEGPERPFKSFRDAWMTVLRGLEQQGHDVFSAHRREAWGNELFSPTAALEQDLAALSESDFLFAYVGTPASPGVQMELGAALAWDKPCSVFVDAHGAHPYLLDGIPSPAFGGEVTVVESLKELVERILARGQTLAGGD